MRASFLLHTDLFSPSPVFRATKEIGALRKVGFTCSAICWLKADEKLPPSEVRDGVQVTRFVYEPRPQRLTSLPERYRDLRKAARGLADRAERERPDLIVPHDLEVLAAGIRSARSRDVPVVYDSHEDWPAMVGETSRLEGILSTLLERRLCRKVSAVVTPSELVAERFRGWGVRAEVLHNSPYRADVEPLPTEVDIRSRRESMGLQGAFIVGYIGRLAPHRGLELTIDALAGLPDDVRFVVVGGPESEAERLRKLAADRGVGKRVTFTGLVPRSEVVRYTATFDVCVVLPPPLSRNYLTTLPNKAYDYMAAGVPILTSDLPSLRQTLVEEAGCAVAVPPQVEAVRTALADLRARRDLRSELGRRGREAFLERYAWDIQETKWLRLLREVGVSF